MWSFISIYFQFMQNQFISAAATASADGDRSIFYMACLSVDNLVTPAPMDERQAAELAHEALVRAAEALRAQLGPATEGDGSRAWVSALPCCALT